VKYLLISLLLFGTIPLAQAGNRHIYGRIQGYTSGQYLYSDTGGQSPTLTL
jgi:hypothetical protein